MAGDILVHELAHVLMDYGLPASLRDEIDERFHASVEQRRLWRRPDGARAYAATNAEEFFVSGRAPESNSVLVCFACIGLARGCGRFGAVRFLPFEKPSLRSPH